MEEKDTAKVEHKIIYFSDNNELTEKHDNKDDTSLNLTGYAKYLVPVIISIMIYSLCAWLTNVSVSEVIDIEIPLIILLTLILTELYYQGYSKIGYLVYIISACLLYSFFNPSYALLVTISFTGVIVTNCIKQIYFNEVDYPNNYSDEYEVKKLFSRVKYYVLLSTILFVIFLLLGYFYPGVFQQLVMPSVNNLHEGVQEGTIPLESVYLFVNNFSVAIGLILGGFYFSVPTIYTLIFNAIFIGFMGAITEIKYFLAFTIPHGIFELSAIVLAGAAGLRITHALLILLNGIKLNKENRKEIFIEGYTKFIKMFADVIILLIIVAVMLFIAAFIEANLTISIGSFLYKL